MALKKSEQEFRLPKISYIDYKQIEIDRTLLNLFPRLRHDGYASRLRNAEQLVTIDKFRDEFIDPANVEQFPGFADHPEIVYKWLETDLLDLVHRGKPDQQAVAAPRPLHGNTYKYRNTRHARDYNSSEQVYWTLYHARNGLGQRALSALKQYMFEGLDLANDAVQHSATIDVETLAILKLPKAGRRDQVDDKKQPEKFPPLCLYQADIFAEDVIKLLAYQKHMPRTVLIDYLKTLLAFHLGLYQLRLLKLLPALVRAQGTVACGLERCHGISATHTCNSRIGVLMDCTSGRDPTMARLARTGAEIHYRRIPAYIEAHFTVKKLDEMAANFTERGRLIRPVSGYFSVGDLLALLSPRYLEERNRHFDTKLQNLLDQTRTEDGQPTEIQRIIELKMSDFETFIEILVTLRGSFHRRYITQCLDSLLQKNTEYGLLRQSRAKGSPRQFALGSRLLELLLQLAVIASREGRLYTREIRVDALVSLLRDRYGLYVDQLPTHDGFEEPTISDRQALRQNMDSFKARLRDIGYFQDLSDAYISQTIAPRYNIS